MGGILERLNEMDMTTQRRPPVRADINPGAVSMGTDTSGREPQPGEIYRTPDNEIRRVVCVAYSPEMKDVLVILHDLRGTGERATSLREFRGGNHPFKPYELVGMSA